MDSVYTSLERDYCPPVDPALFAAIVSDFDLAEAEAVKGARETLDAIKASALEQDTSLFDPSGNASNTHEVEDEQSLQTGEISSEVDASQSQETDDTSASSDFNSLSLKSDKNKENQAAVQIEKLDDASKTAMLKEMFPESSEFGISHTLSKCDGNWNRAVEELLNHTFFNNGGGLSEGEDVISAKGVDAFSEDRIVRRSRKKNKVSQRKLLTEEQLPRASSLPGAARTSPWERSKLDIEFLDSRTNIPKTSISSIYHQNGASLKGTIYALIDFNSKAASAVTANDECVQTNASELAKEFPSLSSAHLLELVCLTHPSTAAAHELAKVLASLDPKAARGGIEVIPRYAPIDLESEDNNQDTTWRAAQKYGSRSSGSSTPTYATGSKDPVAQANHYLAASQHSFAQAASTYRRGRSDHLMSAAAGYYSQQGRDFAVKHAEATSEAADALVLSQSTKNEIDLHGVSVKDAVRISQALVQTWWQERGNKVKGIDGRVRVENDLATGRAQALRIVTGIGRHSSGGKGKIGPAVGRMLASGGWNFRAEEGVLTVYGKRT